MQEINKLQHHELLKASAYQEYSLKRRTLNVFKSSKDLLSPSNDKENHHVMPRYQQQHFISSNGGKENYYNQSNDNMPKSLLGTNFNNSLEHQIPSYLNSSSNLIPKQQQDYHTSYLSTSQNISGIQSRSLMSVGLNIDKSFQYLKSQLGCVDDTSCLYDIIPTKQQQQHQNNNCSYDMGSSFAKVCSGIGIGGGTISNNLSISKQLSYHDTTLSHANQSHLQHHQQQQQKQQALDKSQLNFDASFRQQYLKLPQTTKNLNIQDFLFSSQKQGQQTYATMNHRSNSNTNRFTERVQDISYLSVLSNTFSLEDDYRMLFRYLRLWQKAIKIIKRRRYEKKEFVRNLAAAIHFYEQSLCSKAILSFVKVRVMRGQRMILGATVTKMVTRNIKKFYFNNLVRKYKELKWVQSGHTMAQLFHYKYFRKQVFNTLKSLSRQNKLARNRIYNKLKQNPYALKSMMQLMARFYMKKSTLDIIEFYQYAQRNKRVMKRSMSKFSNSLKEILVYTKSQIFLRWKQHTREILTFKNKMLTKLIRTYFNRINWFRITNKKELILFKKHLSYNKYLAILGLRMHADQQLLSKQKLFAYRNRYKKRIFSKNQLPKQFSIITSANLRNKSIDINKLDSKTLTIHLGKIHSKFASMQSNVFPQLSNLYIKTYYNAWSNFYSQYTQFLKEDDAKSKLCYHNFLKTPFEALRNYRRKRITQKNKRMMSLLHFYEREVSLCFKEWKSISSRNRKTRRIGRKIQREYELGVKQTYLFEWMRRCYQDEMTRRLRKNALQKKVLKSFQNVIRYKNVREEIDVISLDQYHRQLCFKAFKSIKRKIQEKRKLTNVKRAVRRTKDQIILAKVIQELQKYKDVKQLNRQQAKRLKEYKLARLQTRYFRQFTLGVKKSRKLRENYQLLLSYKEQKLKFKTLEIMEEKVDRKQRLKYMEYQFIVAHQTQKKQKIFYGLMNKIRRLQSIGQHITIQCGLNKKSQIFTIWYDSVCQINDYRMKYLKFFHNKNQRLLRLCLQGLTKLKNLRNLKALASYLFLKNYLKKYLMGIRQNSLVKQEKRQILANLKFHRFRSQFKAFQYILKKDMNKRKVYFRQVSTILKKALHAWLCFTQKQSYKRQVVQEALQRRDQIRKLEILSALHQNKQLRGLGNEEYYKHMQLRMKSLILNILKNWGKQRKLMKFQDSKVKYSVNSRIASNALAAWNVEYHLRQKEQKISQPFREQQVQLLVRRCYYIIKDYYQNKKLLQKQHDIIRFHKTKLIMKRIYDQLYILSNQSIKLGKIKSKLIGLIQQNCKSKVLNILYNHSLRKRSLKIKQSQGALIHSSSRKNHYMRLWINKYQRWIKLKPQFMQAESLHEYLLAKKSFKSFYQHKVYKQQKGKMIDSIILFRQEFILQKAFLQMKKFHSNQLKIYALAERINVQFKSRAFQVWRFKFQSMLKFKNYQIQKQKIVEFRQQFKIQVKEKVLGVFKGLLKTIEQNALGFKILEQRIVQVQKRLALLAIKKHLELSLKMEYFHENSYRNSKQRVLKIFKSYTALSKLKHTCSIQSEAFTRLKLLQCGFKAFKLYDQLQKQMRFNYSKTSKIYRKQLLQKSFMILQWNRMRTKYVQNLSFRSEEYNDKRIKQRLFDIFKSLLILKYKGLHLQQKQELMVLSSHLKLWRYKCEQRVSYRQAYKQSLVVNGIDMSIQGNIECESEDHMIKIRPVGQRDSIFYGQEYSNISE